MASQRIKGQEVEVLMIVNGSPVTTLDAVKSFSVTFKLDRLTEEYLGETTVRVDSIFKGIEGKAEFNYSSPEVFTLIQQIVDKARRRAPGTKINIKATLNFPSGQRARLIFPDVEFGELPIDFGSRGDYGSFSIDFGGAEGRVISTG